MTKPIDPNDIIDLAKLGHIVELLNDLEHLPQEYGGQADNLLRATTALGAAKSNLDHVAANIDLQVRKTAELSGAKVTEKRVLSEVESTNAWQTARAEVDRLEATVERYKYALRVLDRKENAMRLLAQSQMKEFGVIHRNS